jgi:hypothetical protein
LEREQPVHHQAPQALETKDQAQHSRLMEHQPLVVVAVEILQIQIHLAVLEALAVVVVEPEQRQQLQQVVQVLPGKAIREEQTQV